MRRKEKGRGNRRKGAGRERETKSTQVPVRVSYSVRVLCPEVGRLRVSSWQLRLLFYVKLFAPD